VFPCVTANGNLYFSSRKASLGKRDLFRAAWERDGFAVPENLGPPINTAADEFDGAVSLDEQQLLFCRGREKAGCDLYFSKRENGAWTPPRILGPEVNFGLGAYCPAWSPDGRWIFFTSTGGDGFEPGIYRIPATVLTSTAPRAKEKARLFAKGRISRMGAFGLTLSPDGKTACFAETHNFIMESKLVNGTWTTPAPLPFTLQGFNFDPSLSPDGRTLFFVSNQPSNDHPSLGEYDAAVWTARKTTSGWETPRRIGNLLDEKIACYVSSPSLSTDGTLYFAGIQGNTTRNSQLFVAKQSAKGFLPAFGLKGISLPMQDEGSVSVSASGKTLIFSSDRPGGIGGNDLYLCRRKADGGWSIPTNLGPGINSQGEDVSPALSGDGSVLYFFSDREGKPGIYLATLKD